MARFIGEGYAKGETITLTSQEHAVLTTALKRRFILASNTQINEFRTLKTVVCTLNRKFERLLGLKLITKGPRQSEYYELNQLLRVPPADAGGNADLLIGGYAKLRRF